MEFTQRLADRSRVKDAVIKYLSSGLDTSDYHLRHNFLEGLTVLVKENEFRKGPERPSHTFPWLLAEDYLRDVLSAMFEKIVNLAIHDTSGNVGDAQAFLTSLANEAGELGVSSMQQRLRPEQRLITDHRQISLDDRCTGLVGSRNRATKSLGDSIKRSASVKDLVQTTSVLLITSRVHDLNFPSVKCSDHPLLKKLIFLASKDEDDDVRSTSLDLLHTMLSELEPDGEPWNMHIFCVCH